MKTGGFYARFQKGDGDRVALLPGGTRCAEDRNGGALLLNKRDQFGDLFELSVKKSFVGGEMVDKFLLERVVALYALKQLLVRENVSLAAETFSFTL